MQHFRHNYWTISSNAILTYSFRNDKVNIVYILTTLIHFISVKSDEVHQTGDVSGIMRGVILSIRYNTSSCVNLNLALNDAPFSLKHHLRLCMVVQFLSCSLYITCIKKLSMDTFGTRNSLKHYHYNWVRKNSMGIKTLT